VARLLDWSQSAFDKLYGFRAVDVGSLRRGSDGDLGSGFGELVYDPASGHVS